MATGPIVKKRTWTRSRRGCKTCKTRHVKCDELYPACQKCTSTGRTCDGTTQPSNSWEVVTFTSISPGSTPDRRPNSARYDEKAEVCFAFFKLHTVNYLAGLLDHQLKALLLGAVEQNDVIYHAAVAMGSMHKTIFAKQSLSTDFAEDIYAVKQYNRSLRILAARPDNKHVAPVDVMLIACILFTGFETLRRNPRNVLGHVNSGVRIIFEHQNDMLCNSKDSNLLPVKQLIPAFARLERQSHEMTGNSSPLIQGYATEQTATGFFEYARSDPQPIPYFSSVNHAWLSLHQRWHAMISFTGGIHQDWFNHLGDVHRTHRPEYKGTREQHMLNLRQDLQLWSLGFERFRSGFSSTTPKEASVICLLQCYGLMAETILGTSSSPSSAMLWDNYQSQFERCVELCRTVIKIEVLESGTAIHTPSVPIVIQHRYTPNNEQHTTHGPLTFDLSVCMALLHIITKCRDARIRLEALQLLEDYPRLEGLWDGEIIAKIGRAIDFGERQGASLEEAAARGASAAEIPLSRRILHIRGQPGTAERRGTLFLLTAEGERGPDITSSLSSFEW